MSLELDNSELNQVQIELNCLSELSMYINDCQNELRNIQNELQTNIERDRKILLDLRLKFGKKIEEAKHYYHALSDVELVHANEAKLRSQLNENQQKLDAMMSEISPEIVHLKSNQIKNLREKINEIKMNMQFLSVQCISKRETVAKLKNKYNRSICLTKDYFQIKQDSVETTKNLIDLLNTYRDKMATYKSQYSTHMSNLERMSSEIHLQRATQNLVNSRLQEPMPDYECLSISSFDLEGDEIKFDDNNIDNLTNHLSHSHNHLDQSPSSNECTLPSPCRSINLPLGYNAGIIVKTSKKIDWHPLL